jgi:hypothetical protein
MKQVTKQTKRYYDGDDIADWSNENKYHTTASHAFKDADYASPIELDPNISDMKKFCGELLFIYAPILAVVIYIAVAVVQGVVK